jgi:hypothetical protein
MITLSTNTSAVALGVELKVLDNILAREGRVLVGPGKRGKSRRITIAALERIAIALILNRDLGVSIARGLELASELLEAPAGTALVGSLGTLRFNVADLRRHLELAVSEALEAVGPALRGRPPARGAGMRKTKRGAP